MKKILLLLICLSTLLCSCTPTVEDSATTTETPSEEVTLPTVTTSTVTTNAETEPPAPEPLALTADFRVIYPAAVTEDTMSTVQALIAALREKSQLTLSARPDVLPAKDGDISVGQTNRATQGNLNADQVLVEEKNGRIYIQAGSEKGLPTAVELFLASITVENGVAYVPSGLRIEKTVIIEEEKTVKLKLATYNIHNGADVNYDFRVLAQDILNSGAEVVALQEVDQNTTRNQNQDTLALLKQYTGWQYGFFVAGLENYKGGQYGVAILSKHPIVSTSSVELPELQEGLERRVLLEAVVEVEGMHVAFFVAHCNQISISLQLGKMAERAAGKEPYIVMGDFNYQKIDLFRAQFPKATFANLDSTRYITTTGDHAFDNMIFSEGIRRGTVSVIKTGHSDHYLFYAEVEIPVQK